MNLNSSLPLEQSMVVSDVDWKNDPYNIITEDEKQFTEISASAQEAEFEDPKVLCEQSWGLYFAKRSGAMGNISGTSKRRPQFSSPEIIRLAPQTPPDTVSILNQSLSVPRKMPSDIERTRPNAKLNRSYIKDDTLFIDDQMDIDNEEDKENNPRKLSIEDLLSPQQNKENVTPFLNRSLYQKLNLLSPIKKDGLCVNNLLPHFEDCHIDDPPITDDTNNDIELQKAIESAIQRRKSFEPQVVIEKSKLNQNESKIEHVHNDTMNTTIRDIEKYHRFIQFYLIPEKMETEHIDDIKRACNDMLHVYESNINEISSVVIHHQTFWLNINTNQCTFYFLVSHGTETDKWSQAFFDILDKYQWVQSNKHKIVFSQFLPE